MKPIYTVFLLVAMAIIFLGSSNGPGNVQGQDRTGSPVANGSCANAGCHAAGAFNPSISLEVLQDGMPVTVYTPGQSYTMRVTIAADANAAVYGFQAVALLDGNTQAGSFTAAAGTQVTPLSGRQYVEHSQRSTSNTFEVMWTAPAAGSGDVRFFSAGVAANNLNGPAGDGTSSLAAPVVLPEIVVGTRELPELASDMRLFPNPVQDIIQLSFTAEETTNATLRLFDTSGKTVWQKPLQVVAGQNQLQNSVANLPAGHYVLEVAGEKAVSRLQMVKQ
ncbi:MAG: choice-of-anchor V domain-containing protein [Saprospiraceae bacterium]